MIDRQMDEWDRQMDRWMDMDGWIDRNGDTYPVDSFSGEP